MWRVFLGNTMSGELAQAIDVPGFTWSISVSDASFKTGRDVDKGVGQDDLSKISLPWSAIPADDPSERNAMLMPLKRSVCLIWDDGSRMFPVAWGAVGPRTDTYLDTEFDLISPMALLESRYLVREGVFGAVAGMTEVNQKSPWEQKDKGYSEGATVSHNGHDWKSQQDENKTEPGTPGALWEDLGESEVPQEATFTQDTVAFAGMSLRGIAAEVGSMCTDSKPGGQLPIDWQYRGEAGGHERTYCGFDVGNLSCSDIFRKIANVDGGPDLTLRPYMADGTHVRILFVAGSDADQFVGQRSVHAFSFSPHGGSAENIKVDFAEPVMRVYATGSGTDEAQICHLSEDLSLCRMPDPWPLMESHYNDSDADSGALLTAHSDAELSSSDELLMQVSFDIDFNDPNVPPPGSIWPGEMIDLWVEGFPSLPDGRYSMRLMEMSGNDSSTATLMCRPIAAPVY